MAVSKVDASASAVTLLAAANPRRGGCSVYYDGAAILYLLADEGTPTSTNYTIKMGSGYATYWEPPASGESAYQGKLSGIWSAATGSALVTEFL